MSQDRTEKPTLKRLKDAREKGQIARSRDLALAAASVAATIAFAWLGSHLMLGLLNEVKRGLATFGDAPLRTITAGELSALIASGAISLGWLVGPIALVTTVAAVGMHGFQGGWSFAPGALRLHWSRLNPASGMKRFGFSQSGVETIKAIVAFVAIGYFTWRAVEGLLVQAPELAWLSPEAAAAATWTHAENLLWKAAWTLGVLALADYAWQRYNFTSSMKMTRQEVRDEHRQNEGNAEVKGRVRRIQRSMSQRRMLADVATATVVITNPTHYAVALEYKRESMSAPRVVAMGADHMAKRIRDKAIAHGVPLVENKALARSLYATADVGQVIPAPLFAAVAEVLAYLIRVKRLVL
jgi:flagellar biosynthetic protein FlhB